MTKLNTIRLSCALLIIFIATSLQAKTTGEATGNGKLAFKENNGQVTDQYYQSRKDIDFNMQTLEGMNIFIGDGQLHYQWNKTDGNADVTTGAHTYKVESYRLDVELQGANRNAEVISEGRSQDYDHYYKEYLPLEGARVYSYSKVTYKNIYPKIDWVLYSVNNELKYDFIVHPGGNPAVIKLKYTGANTLEHKDGSVVVTTPLGSITEGKPYSYEAETGKEVPSSFLIDGFSVGFSVGTATGDIVIDPSVNWVTCYGGGSTLHDEFGKGLKADAAGNVYMAGATSGSTNVATIGAHQTVYAGNVDGFFVKFNAAGVRQWGAYYGGASRDYFTSIALDASGNVYVAGVGLSSSGIATPGANIIAPAASNELMLVKFNTSGVRTWGSYCRGGEIFGSSAAFESSAQICCDPAGEVFMNHATSIGLELSKFNSSGVPYWNNAWQTNSYTTTGITCNATGEVYVLAMGGAGAYDDGFWAKFSNNGLVQFNTTFGIASYAERPCGIDVDAVGNVYISGETTSPTGIATAGTNRTTVSPNAGGPNFDGFAMKFNSAGVKQWGTYVGMVPKSFRMVVAAGLNDKIYLGAVSDYNGASGYMYTLNSNTGMAISFIKYTGVVGGLDNCLAIAYSPSGNVFIAGQTENAGLTGFITAGAHQTTFSGTASAYLACFGVDTIVSIHQPFDDTVMCTGNTFKLPYDVNSNFGTGNTFTAYLSDATGSFASPVSIGSITTSVADTIVCTIPVAAIAGTGYRIRIAASAPVSVSADNGDNIRIQNTITPAILTYTASPGSNVGPWVSVTFSVTLSGAGSSPTYQWKKNGTDISGATGSTYTGVTNVDFTTGDAITVEVTSSETCASPATVTSSPEVININTGINNSITATGWQVYPNPTAGMITLTASIQADAVIEVMNVTGQVVYETQARAVNGRLKKDIQLDSRLVNGIYLLRVTSGETTQTLRFSIER